MVAWIERSAEASVLGEERPNEIVQTLELGCVMPEKLVIPNSAGSLAAITRQRPSDGFVGTETGALEPLGLRPAPRMKTLSFK